MPPSDRQEDARAAFALWASTRTACPRDPETLVEGVERSDDHAGLMHTDIEGRRVRWESTAFRGKARVSAPSLSIEQVDAWDVDAASLREQSDHIGVCDACTGAGKNTCDTCAGSGNLTCGDCGGQRKRYGYAANGSRRLLNCTSCRGKGEVNCPDCRRGVATCVECDGNGRVQRWIELEWWRRSVSSQRPDWIARQLGWTENPSTGTIARDADVLLDIQRPHRLTGADTGTLPAQWLTDLAASLMPGERVVQQHLRIARVPVETVQYRLGSDVDRAPFTGRRLLAPPAQEHDAFSRRASHLRGFRRLLSLVFLVIVFLSLARGLFYWSIPTFVSLGAAGAALGAIYGSFAEWTGARRRVQQWIATAASCALIALGSMYAAMPRLAHAQKFVTSGDLDAAERELQALGEAPASAWADLHVARIRGTRTHRSHAPRSHPFRAISRSSPSAQKQPGACSSAMRKITCAAIAGIRQWTRFALHVSSGFRNRN